MKYLNYIIFILVSLILAQAISAAVGVSPGRIDVEGVLKEGYAEQEVLVTSSSNEIEYGAVQFKGEISDWMQIKNNETIFNLSFENPHSVILIISPPENLQTANYSGSVIISSLGSSSLPGRAGGILMPSISIPLNIEVVGDQRISCTAGGFTIYDSEVNSPIDIKSTIKNTGNVRVRPEITLKIFNQDQTKVVEETRTNTLEILPTLTQTSTQKINNNLDPGQYWAEINVEQCNAQSFETFTILEKGQIADKGMFVDLKHKTWAYENETILIAAVFKNIGERPVSAKFEGIISLNGAIVKKISSDELDALPGETIQINNFFEPPSEGIFKISGRIKYNKKITEEKSTIINVSPGIRKKSSNYTYIVFLGLIIVIIVILRLIVRKIRSRKN